MKRFAILGVLMLGVLAWAVAGSAVADPPGDGEPGGNHYPSQSDPRDCGDGDEIVFDGATVLWPPNHKYRSSTVVANGSDATEMVTLSTTVTSDEAPDALGSGNTGDDTGSTENPPAQMSSGTGSAGPNTHTMRAERSGIPLNPGEPDSGRTYTIEAVATFDNGTKECTETFEVNVPHDMRDRRSLIG